MTHAKSQTTAMIGGREVALTDGDINLGFWYTADLFDNNHLGPATITLESGTFAMTELEWHNLYYLTDPIVRSWLAAVEREFHTLH